VTVPQPPPDSPQAASDAGGKACAERRGPDPNLKKGAPWIKTGIADADKKARTGRTVEAVRTTPPAGAWNDTASD
jgi:hypothetical protein